MSFFQQKVQEFKELERPKQFLLGGLGLLAIGFLVHALFFQGKSTTPTGPKRDAAIAAPKVAGDPANPVEGDQYRPGLPKPSRNQGIEDITAKLDMMDRKIDAFTSGKPLPQTPSTGAAGTTVVVATPPGSNTTLPPTAPPALGGATGSANTGGAAGNTAAGATFNPSAPVPPVDFGPGTGTGAGATGSGQPGLPPVGGGTGNSKPVAQPSQTKVWNFAGKAKNDAPDTIYLPISSGVEAVLLSGMYALPAGSANKVGGNVASSTGAVPQRDVGTPFVSKVKGDALLANGWRSMALNDCRITGSGIAVLSKERVSVTSDMLVCISNTGVVYEGEIKAYGLDVDGIEGLAGKAVSKQGSILLQAFFTGMVSGLGQAIAPTSIPSYNSNATNGQQAQYQVPNPSMLAAQGFGQGLQNSGNQLTRFYLDFARDMFPVIEVASGVRVTWVLKKGVELKKRDFMDKEGRR